MQSAIIMCLITGVLVLGIMCLIGYAAAWLVFVVVVIFLAVILLLRYIFPAARIVLQFGENKRMSATDLLVECIGGIGVIRCFQQYQRFSEIHRSRVSTFYKAELGERKICGWLGIRACLIGSLGATISILVLLGVFLSRDDVLKRVASAAAGAGTLHIYLSGRYSGLSGILLGISVLPPLAMYTAWVGR